MGWQTCWCGAVRCDTMLQVATRRAVSRAQLWRLHQHMPISVTTRHSQARSQSLSMILMRAWLRCAALRTRRRHPSSRGARLGRIFSAVAHAYIYIKTGRRLSSTPRPNPRTVHRSLGVLKQRPRRADSSLDAGLFSLAKPLPLAHVRTTVLFPPSPTPLPGLQEDGPRQLPWECTNSGGCTSAALSLVPTGSDNTRRRLPRPLAGRMVARLRD